MNMCAIYTVACELSDACVCVCLMADIVDKFQVQNSENIYDLTFV